MAKGRTNKQGGASVSLTGDAVVTEVLNSKTFYNTDPKTKLTGTMPNKVGSATIIIPSTSDQTIPQGYYGGASGDGKVIGDANLISANIKSGVNIFGVAGNYSPGGSWTIPTYASGDLNAALPNGTYTGSGVVYVCSTLFVGASFMIFYNSSFVVDYNNGTVTSIDGVNILGIKAVGRSTTQTIYKYQEGDLYYSNRINNLSYSGSGVAYLFNTANNGKHTVFFNNSLVTTSYGAVIIDGVTTQLYLLGYSIPA